MFMRCHRCLAALALLLFLGVTSQAASEPSAPPRLAVLVFFDQMRGDYLERWDELFGAGGFHRLEKDGAWFRNCHYPYSDTVTGAGHASVATGAAPKRHGIIENEWYERGSGLLVNCVGTDRYEQVPPRLKKAKSEKTSKPTAEETVRRQKATGASPERLLVPTLADALKAATDGKSRVVSLSLKDRSAVLPGGRRPDACYWLNASTGQFVTSTYYRARLHPWVEEHNRGKPIDRWLGHPWTRLRPDLDYAKYSGPDDVKGEGSGFLQERTFPHPMNGGPLKMLSLYRGAVVNSPFGNELLLDLARRAIKAEKLGKHDVPDLLCVSFSSNDIVGHCWGPDSQEVMDITLRSDEILKELLACLDAEVGKGRYVLAVTADHGVCPLPEVASRQGREAARLSPELLGQNAQEFLDKTFPAADGGTGRWIEATAGPWIYLNRSLLRARGLKQDEVEKALATWLAKQKGIQAAYTRTQLLKGVPGTDTLGQRLLRSFHPERSGDVVVVVKPYHLITSQLTGTNHGTPHAYDTHVPLLVYGPGIRPGVRRESVTPLAAAVILAHSLGIRPPAAARAPLPEGLFAPARSR